MIMASGVYSPRCFPLHCPTPTIKETEPSSVAGAVIESSRLEEEAPRCSAAFASILILMSLDKALRVPLVFILACA